MPTEILFYDTRPPLLVVSPRMLSPDAVACIRKAIQDGTKPGKVIVLDGGLALYQLVDGRYQQIGPAA